MFSIPKFKFNKAYVSAIVVAGGSLIAAGQSGGLTTGAVLTAIVAGLASLGIVAVVPNKPGTTK